MRTKKLKLACSPSLLTAVLLSTSLLLNGCSSNDDVNEVSANDSARSVDNSAAVAENQTTANTTESSSNDLIEQEIDSADDTANTSTEAISDVTNPALATGEQPSLVNNPTQAGTPEDTVKQAFDTLYYGDVKKAATYYKVDIANFEQELAKAQYTFQQTVEGITITDTTYNDDKTRATIEGELMLKGQKQPAPLSYELQKINGKWKILG